MFPKGCMIRRTFFDGDDVLPAFVVPSIWLWTWSPSRVLGVASTCAALDGTKLDAWSYFDTLVTTGWKAFRFLEEEKGVSREINGSCFGFENTVLFDSFTEKCFGVVSIASFINSLFRFLLTECWYKIASRSFLRQEGVNLRRNTDDEAERFEKSLVWNRSKPGGRVAVLVGVNTGEPKQRFFDADNFGERFLSGPVCTFFLKEDTKCRSTDAVADSLAFSSLRDSLEDGSPVDFEKDPTLGDLFSCLTLWCCEARFAWCLRRES